MIRSTAYQRAMFGEKVLDLANYAMAALVFGQFLAQQPVSYGTMFVGLATWLVSAAIAFWLTGEQ